MAIHLLPLLLAGALAGSPVQAPQVAKTAAAASPAERTICKRSRKTESRMGAKRVCKTAAQWKMESDDSLADQRGALSGKTR